MSLQLQLRDYRVTTAEIVYRLPDYPALLQMYVWQDLDLAPSYPILRRFLDFWSRNLDGSVHAVRVCHGATLRPAGLLTPSHMLTLH